jgi:uncharacterized protein (DUF1501 family)
MASRTPQRALVVVQLSGGNDALNTVVPYTNGLYYDNRPQVNIAPEDVLPISDTLGFHPSMGPIKQLWDEGKVAVINGIGYPHPNRSHFRSLDVWHTAESEHIGQEGWLGKVIRDLDPKGENVLTGVNFGRGLLRSLYAKGVPVASVGNLETYGLFPDIQDERLRHMALQAFSQMYGGEGKDMIAQYLTQMGTDALKGADILRVAPQRYTSSITYPNTPIAQNMKAIAQVLSADIGTRVYHTEHRSFDTHAAELTSHAKLWTEVSTAIGAFMADLQEHGQEEHVVILLFSEFGRRIRDNGAGTDHGSGGVAFVVGTPVQGGTYGEYPSLRDEDQLEGDLHFTNDFRSTYSTLVDRWLRLDPVSITNGTYEQFNFI